jgi:hypothetical protein
MEKVRVELESERFGTAKLVRRRRDAVRTLLEVQWLEAWRGTW